MINEETIRSFFSRYGEIKDVSIKKNDFNPLTQKRSGYGFLHFPLTVSGIQAALQVTRDFHNVLVKDVYFNCSVTHELNQILDRCEAAITQTMPEMGFPPDITALNHVRYAQLHTVQHPLVISSDANFRSYF